MKTKAFLVLTLASALACTAANSVSAAIINITPSKDNTLYEYDPADGDTNTAIGLHVFSAKAAMS